MSGTLTNPAIDELKARAHELSVLKITKATTKYWGEFASLDIQFPVLEELSLTDTSMHAGELAVKLGKTSRLKKLLLRNFHSINADLVLNAITNLTELEELDLGDSSITAASLAAILNGAPKLKKLCLNNCTGVNVDLLRMNADVVLKSATKLTELEELDLSRSSITSASLAAILSKTPNLKKLNLHSCNLINEDIILNDATKLEKLEELDLSNSSITAAGLAAILNKAPNIRAINLRRCSSINADIVLNTGIIFSELESLNLGFSSITAAGLAAILNKAPKLKKLNLGGCRSINADIVNAITNLRELEELNLSHSSITAASLAAILNKAPKLKKLNLGSCRSINADIVLNADTNLAELQELTLTDSSISRNTIATILLAAPNINWSAEKFLSYLSRDPAAPDKLDEAIALHLFYKHELTPEQQKQVISRIQSIPLQTLLASKFTAARHYLAQEGLKKEALTSPQVSGASARDKTSTLLTLPAHIAGNILSFAGARELIPGQALAPGQTPETRPLVTEAEQRKFHMLCKAETSKLDFAEMQQDAFNNMIIYSAALKVFLLIKSELRKKTGKTNPILKAFLDDKESMKFFREEFFPKFNQNAKDIAVASVRERIPEAISEGLTMGQVKALFLDAIEKLPKRSPAP